MKNKNKNKNTTNKKYRQQQQQQQQQQLTTESSNKNKKNNNNKKTFIHSNNHKQNQSSKHNNNKKNKQYYLIHDTNNESELEEITRLLDELRYHDRQNKKDQQVIRILGKSVLGLLTIFMLGIYYYHIYFLASNSNNNNNAAIGVTAATMASSSATATATATATPTPGSPSSSQKKRERERGDIISKDQNKDDTTTTADTITTPDLSSSSSSSSSETDTVTIMTNDWTLLNTYPHDPTSFTQGLEVVPFHQNHKYDHDPIMEECSNTNNNVDVDVDVDVGDDKATTTSCRSNNNNNKKNEEILLMESTGMHGQSLIRIWNPQTGTTIKETKLDSKLFGEGICRYTEYNDDDDDDDDDDDAGTENGREFYVQLTYQEETLLIYDAITLEVVRRFPWPSQTTTKEGWGIVFNPTERVFYVSDGSHYIHVWDTNFHEIKVRKMKIHINEMKDTYGNVYFPRKTTNDENGTPQHHALNYINELDYDPTTNTILANKILEDIILRIDPHTGVVLNVYDFSKLYPRRTRQHREDVFNGIAIIPDTNGKEWFLTGKYWSLLYHIRIND